MSSRASTASAPVSPGNPCPFLRALVAEGLLPDERAPIGDVTRIIQDVARTGEGAPRLPGAAIRAIALMANGIGPGSLVRNGFGGVRINALRNGPLDKKGVGSGILDAQALVVQSELDRLDEFASDKIARDGSAERGLDLKDLTRMMDANFARAAGRRRSIDRKLMDGEWPILLKVMGKPGKSGRYLSVSDVRALFTERKLPDRMRSKVAARGG